MQRQRPIVTPNRSHVQYICSDSWLGGERKVATRAVRLTVTVGRRRPADRTERGPGTRGRGDGVNFGARYRPLNDQHVEPARGRQ